MKHETLTRALRATARLAATTSMLAACSAPVGADSGSEASATDAVTAERFDVIETESGAMDAQADRTIADDSSMDSAGDSAAEDSTSSDAAVETGTDAATDATSRDSATESGADAACASGQRSCSGRCVDTQTNAMHCGACDAPCMIANSSAVCAAGVCAVGTCNAGFADCDSIAASGCEVDTNTNVAHCGACRRPCAAITNGTPACNAGTCGVGSCNAGFHPVGGACVADGGVRPISPISLGDTSLRRPTLRFALPTGADGAVIELCRDRACTMVIETLRVTAVTARPTAALPASSVVFWRARARVGASEDAPTSNGPTWLFHTPVTDNTNGVDTSVNPHLDVNGDGFDDVAVGASGVTVAGQPHTGNVTVFHGSATGVSAAAALVLEGIAAQDSFGGRLACAGDVNGDGFADLAVAALTADRGALLDVGAVSVFHGGPSGLRATASRLVEGGAQADGFGFSLSSAGDVNRDGFADIIVGARGADPGGRNGAGTASVFHGSVSGIAGAPARVIEGAAASDGLGFSVAGSGDVNGDGYSDVFIGAPGASPGGRASAGTASVYHGGAAGIPVTAARVLEGSTAGSFGTSVSNSADVNNDGFSDAVVGAPFVTIATRTYTGTVSIFHGAMTGVSPSAARVLEGVITDDRFGNIVASAGDVNRDGFCDVLVGTGGPTLGAMPYSGRASVFHGAATGVAATATTQVAGQTNSFFSHAASGAGDVNGDGFADIIVGALEWMPSFRPRTGSAFVFHGAPAGVSSAPARSFEGAAFGDKLGAAVAQLNTRGWGRSTLRGCASARPRNP